MGDGIPTGEATEPIPALLSSTPAAVIAPHPGRVFVPKWLAIGIALVLIGGLGFAIGWIATPDDASQSSSAPSRDTTPTTPSPSTTGPPATTTPSASALSDLGLRQGDLTSSVSLQLIPGGNRVAGAPTLDLCNGTFPSESERKARLQVVAVDAQGNATLSTEAVLYANAAATERAFTELDATAAKCPSSPVRSPVGESTVTTMFNPAPDGSWPQVASVDRLAYEFVTTDESGQTQHSIAVYLRRGRALMGIYFPDPDSPQSAVAGKTTIPGIVNVFATRMAQLPDSVVD
ncbi:MAG: hypothetical protein WD271_09695 [Acidimicrobiia bacterium]